MSSVTRRRTTCGTTSPTKPIGPATATAAPQSSAIASRPSSRVWTRLTPRPSATLSPSASTLSRGAMSSATPRPISAGTSAVCSVLQFSPARSPASQVRIASSVCSSRINIAAVTADANPDSATPHNVMRSGVAPPRPAEASAITPPNSSPAPQAAVSGRPAGKRRRTGPAPRSPPPPARRRR